jgi:hypothetical protein
MNPITRGRTGYLATLAVGIALGCAAVAAPAASAARSAPAAKTVTHHYSLAASAFAPDGLHDTSEDYYNQWDPANLSNLDTARCFNAGLSLPPSVTLKSITFYYTAGTSEMYYQLNRQDLVNHTYTEMVSGDTATVTTPAYTSVTRKIASADAVVNMGTYAYSVGVCPNPGSPSVTFSGITITYTQPAS